MFELGFLLVFMILAAIIAVETKDLLSAVIAVGAVGLGLSVAFLILKAPDLAIVQLVVEILCLIILIRATIKRDRVVIEDRKAYFALTVVGLLGITTFLSFASIAVMELPVFGKPLMDVSSRYIERALTDTGAANIVSSVILDYRAYDTLGEATVLFTAVIGVMAVLRRIGRKKPGEEVSAEDE